MTRSSLLVAALALLVSLPADSIGKEPAGAWVHEVTDLAPDPDVTFGRLDNGLRYAILPHDEPPNRVSLRLYVDAGSLMEEDDQQGLAHFLEHMAFNGSKNFPAGEMVEYFQRLGMAFGSHTNAHTSFKETVYKLELPEAKPEMLEDGFKLLRDYADGLLLGEDEVDKERGVILAEKRSRDSASWRSFVDWVGFALPESRVSDRLPIGTEEVISGAPRERFVEFYHQWYTADRMAVVVVGEVQPEAIESLLRQHFADLRAATPAAPDPDLGEIPAQGVVAHHYSDPEASDTQVSIETKRVSTLGKDSAARRELELKLRLASSMISRRLEILSKEKGSPIIRGSTHHSDLFDLGFVEYASIDATCEPANWDTALSVIDQELRRALQFGFTGVELVEAKANFLERAENQAKTAPTRKSQQLADALVSRIGSSRVFTHPDADLDRVRPLLDAITAEDCLAELRQVWGDLSQLAIYASGNLTIEGGEKAILAAYQKSKAIAVAPPEAGSDEAFAYGAEEEPAGIASREYVADLDITQLRFPNQVRVNLKVTDFEEQTIQIMARIGGGLLTLPEDQEGLAMFAGAIMSQGGLEAHSVDELRRILAGRTVGANFSVGDDAFELSGATTPDDLLLQLQLMRAAILHPGYRPEAERQFDKNLDALYNQLRNTPSGVMNNEVDRFIHGGDPRFGYPAREILENQSLPELKSWLEPHLGGAYLELTLVGDFELDAAIDAVSRTFGNLPPRDAVKPPYPAARQVAFPEAGGAHRFTCETKIPKAMSLVYWPTTDMSDIERTRRLGLLSSIFRDRLRLKVREELGDAYSPYARNTSSETFTDYGYLFALIEAAPEQAETLVGVIREIGAALASEGATPDELDRAKKPMLTMIEEYRRTNGYWLGSVMGMCQEYPGRLDWARNFVSDYESISVKEINELAGAYLPEERSVAVLIVPDTP